MSRITGRERKATKRPRAWTASRAKMTLEGPGGIARLLKTLVKGWPEELADFETVFDLVVRRCRIEFGADRFLAYLCRALLHERAYQKIRRKAPRESWALALERVSLTITRAFQAPSFAGDVEKARALAEAVSNPGHDSSTRRWLIRKQEDLLKALGQGLIPRRKGSPRGIKKPRKQSRPDTEIRRVGQLIAEVVTARTAERLEALLRGERLSLSATDARHVAKSWRDDRIADALRAVEVKPALAGGDLSDLARGVRMVEARMTREEARMTRGTARRTAQVTQ